MLSAAGLPGQDKWMYDNLDISEMASYTALTVVMRHWDSGGKNFYLVRDTEGSGRWQILSWDLDGIFNGATDPKGDFVIPDTSFNKLYKSLFAIPAFRAMHFRHLRTLSDKFLTGNTLLTQFDTWTTCCGADVALDKAKWGGPSVARPAQAVKACRSGATRSRRTPTRPRSRPSQSATRTSSSTRSSTPRYRTAMPSTSSCTTPRRPTPVDMSGWVLTGLGDYVIPPGTVLLPHGYGVVVKDDVAFRAAYGSGQYVIGQYDGKLDNSGDDADPDGRHPDGRHGELHCRPLRGRSRPTAPARRWSSTTRRWTTPTRRTGTPAPTPGTPDATNTGGGGGGTQTVVLPFGASWKYLATGPDQGTAWRASGFNDGSWASGTGDLGFKNANHTTIPARRTG